ncbi:MAG: efflux transporter periplasmic adaptor subunit [Myxococcaceae bacterium]|nr:efflux transporter periplasmic adaptor subunit [Myxococcaceae bacterium]
MKHTHSSAHAHLPTVLLAAAALALSATPISGCSDRVKPAAASSSADAQEGLTLDPSSPALKFVKIEELKPSDAAPNVSLTGRITFDEDRTQRVATPIDGRATAILAKLGDHVKPGQSLVELSSPQVGQLQADAQKTQQDLMVAQKTVDRLHTLKVDGAVSEKEVGQAEADLQKAKSDAGRTAAQLRSIGISASDPAVAVSIRAAVAGTVVERNVLVGQEVRADATTPLMTITNLDTVWVNADVYEQDLGLVTSGAVVDVRVPAYPGDTFPGTIAHLGDLVDPTSRTVKLRCVVPNPKGKLKPEMFAKIALADAAGKQVLVIPARAVLNEAGKFRVIVVEGNLFRPVNVEVGPEVDGRVRVLAGLKAGDKVVTDGALFLKHDIDNK